MGEQAVMDGVVPFLIFYIYFQFLSNLNDIVIYEYDAEGRLTGTRFNPAPLVEQTAQLAIIGGRLGADVRYDALVYDPRSGMFSIEGLSVSTEQGGFELDGLRISAISNDDTAVVDVRVEFDGLTLDPERFDLPPQIAMQPALLGIDVIRADGSLDVSYDVQTSDATALLNLDVENLGRVAANVELGALRLEFDLSSPRAFRRGPTPAGEIRALSVAVENTGGFTILNALMGVPSFDEATAEQLSGLVGEQIRGFFVGADRDPAADPSTAPQSVFAFTDMVEGAITRFLLEQDQIALSIDPAQPVRIQDLEALDRVDRDAVVRVAALELFNPRLQASPVLPAPVIVDVNAPEVDLETRATALITGVGAPRNLDQAIELLAPAAQDGDVTALELLIRALRVRDAEGDAAAAYAAALAAEALGSTEGGSMAAEIATTLPIEVMLLVETEALDETQQPELKAAAADGDVTAMRRLALAYEQGEGVHRNHLEAYRWATLAAAGGDVAAARVRDRMAARFELATAGEQALWSERLAAVDAEALAQWNEGLGAAVAAFVAR